MAARETRLIVSDRHGQAQHPKAWKTLLKIADVIRPNRVEIIGDFIDTYSLSHHPKRQPGIVTFESEMEEGEKALQDLRDAVPRSCEIDYLQGNHEGWADSFEAMNPNLEGTLSIPKKLGLKQKKIRWVSLFEQDADEGKHFRVGPVAYLHGVYEGNDSAKKHALNYGPAIGCKYVVFGHTHGMESFTSVAGYTARSCGFLGDRRHVAFKYRKGKPSSWVLGFLVQDIVGNAVSDTEVRIDYATGRAAFRGRVYGA